MTNPRNLLSAGLVAGLLLAAPEAEARFGKRSRSNDDSSESSGKKSKVHDATAVGADSDEDDGDSGGSHASSRGSRVHAGTSFLNLFVGLLVDAATPSTVYVSPEPVLVPEGSVSTTQRASPLTWRLGLEGGGMSGGASVGLLFAVEGERLGFNGRYTGLALPTEDGTPGTDRIGLLEGNLSYALWASERGRWRVEAGVSAAKAPDITFVGLGFATSVEACLIGALDFEGRLQAVPFPYRQVDAQAGLALHLSPFAVRGGWRSLVLDDAGHVDGERHVETLSGPYLGVALVF